MSRGEHARDEAAAQLSVLRALKQQPAAVLVGWTSRGLRDSGAPRNKDGSYDGVKLVKWMLERERAKVKVVDSKVLNQQLLQLKVRKETREQDRADGRIIDTEEVGRIIRMMNLEVREQVAGLASKYGQDIVRDIGAIADDADAIWKTEISKLQ
jgi:hypothetical protein